MSAAAVLTEDSGTLLSFRPPHFAMDVAPDSGRAEVSARGDVDLATCDALTEIGLIAVRQESVAELVIDLGAVTFLDASGLGSLVAIRNASLEHGKNLVLRNVPARITWLLERTELLELFRVAAPRSA